MPFLARERLLNPLAKKSAVAPNRENKNVSLSLGITIITLAENVTFTIDELENYAKKLPKAAVGQDCAMVIHTQQTLGIRSTTELNPMVSFVYKKYENWQISAQTLENFLGTKKEITPSDIPPYTIKHPNLYEIKDVYLFNDNGKPTALLITKKEKLGSWADGVYKVTLPGQSEKSLSWHVPLQKRQFSLNPTTQMVASAFNKASNTLYLITNNQFKNKKKLEQQLITIDFKKEAPHIKASEGKEE